MPLRTDDGEVLGFNIRVWTRLHADIMTKQTDLRTERQMSRDYPCHFKTSVST